MKTITEILAGAQALLDISFDIQQCFEENLSDEQKTFMHLLRVIEQYVELPEHKHCGRGRPPYPLMPFLRGQFAKCYFEITSNKQLIARLKADPNLRLLCGFNKVPGRSTFSRAFISLVNTVSLDDILKKLAIDTFKDKVVYHVSRDSTAIAARESVKKEEVKEEENSAESPANSPKPREKHITKTEAQLTQEPAEALKVINKECAWGSKKNSQGKSSFWKGYKPRLDVSDSGFPLNACVSAANVHDCLLAIPMEKQTEERVSSFYSLMDRGYDAKAIASYIESRGRIPIIDSCSRSKKKAAIPLEPAKKERYKIRSSVERANGHLKDNLIPHTIYVKGYAKVSFVLLSAVICLAALKHLKFRLLP